MFELGLRASLKCFEKTLLLCEVGKGLISYVRIANYVVRKEGRMCTPQLDTTSELVILERH
jgi:hypothetical protein